MKFSIWDLPGPDSFTSDIADDIRLGRNVFLLLPETVPGGLYDAIKNKLDQENIILERISAVSISQSSPAYDLHQVYNTEKGGMGALDIPSLCRCDNFKSRVIWLSDIVQLGPKEQQWYDFLKQYALACGNQGLIDRSLFIVPIYGQHVRDNLPIENLLTHHWFWGRISSLDLQIYASRMLSAGQSQALRNRLLINVITSLCGYDLSAAESLCRQMDTEENALIHTLTHQVLEREWNNPLIPKMWEDVGEVLEATGWETGSSKPRHSLMKLWATGMLDRMDGRVMISPVAEIARESITEIRQRIWRGHVQSLLPIVDEYRLKVIHHLQTNYSLDLKNFNNESGILEIGTIKYHIEINSRLRKRIDRDLRNFIQLLTRIRNDLAHLKPISSALIMRLENSLQTVFGKGV